MPFMYRLITPLSLFAVLFLVNCTTKEADSHLEKNEVGRSFEYWNLGRMYPDGQLHTDRLLAAAAAARATAAERGGLVSTWEGIGPKNIGGRTLCMAIHPQNDDLIFLGSASGGLWKTTTQGIGVEAWQRVETGFPVIGVGAIAIDPVNPNIMYIGTGEVYNVENSTPNIVIRTTRGTYGIGILKSTDGGQTWQKSWDANYNDLTGIQEIKINPLRPQSIWATTTSGVLRSYDGGAHWTQVLERKMAVDLDFSPSDTSTVFVTFGSLDDADISGIFRTKNGGNSFEELTTNLPAGYTGKALLDISKSQPNTVYVSIGNVASQQGLFKSTNNGDTWQTISTQNVCSYQGWYSHDIAIHPTNPSKLLWCGIDMWSSADGGVSVGKVTYWYNWFFGQVPAGGPEGPGDYVHADIHHIYYHPTDPNLVYCVTDGGLFASKDGGNNWEGRNGGYQTQQFYANFSNSAYDPLVAIGGMQDNSTAIYTGDPSWTRVIGGDGGCTAINPFEHNIMYASSQYGNVYSTVDLGASWENFPASPGANAAFIAPFELAPSNSALLYKGTDVLSRYDFSTASWEQLTIEGGFIVSIGVSQANANDVYYSTGLTGSILPKVYHVDAAIMEQQEMTGLPDRLCTDIARDPFDDAVVYLTFSGFGTAHLYKTTNSGGTWTAIVGLPDVPTNSVLIDPVAPSNIYVANDLGVWFSSNDGFSWQQLTGNVPQAMLAMHLSVSADRQLRVATHGLGIWQTPMVFTVGTKDAVLASNLLEINPNPATDVLRLHWKGAEKLAATVKILDNNGRTILGGVPMIFEKGSANVLSIGQLNRGTYLLLIEGTNGQRMSKRFVAI